MPKIVLQTPQVVITKTCFRDSTVELCICLLDIPNNEIIQDVLKQMNSVFDLMMLDKRKYYTVYDLRQMSCPISQTLIVNAVEFLRTIREKLAVSCICSIIIFESVVIQTAVKVILSLYAPIKPVHFCKNHEDMLGVISTYRPNRV